MTTTGTISEPTLPLSVARVGLSRTSFVLVLIYASIVLCFGLGTGRVLTQHEVFAAEPAKEMLRAIETGRVRPWIIPEFAGVPRTVKPPTTGWLIAASMTIFQSDAEWVARLPAAVAGVITCLLVAWLGGRYFSDRLGLVAGLMQATTFYTLMQARLAEADMILCLSVLCAMICFIVGNIQVPSLISPGLARDSDPSDEPKSGASPGLKSRVIVYLFYFFSAFSLLAKGVGPVFIFPACVLWLLLRRDWRVFRFFLSPIGIVIFLLVAGSWPTAAYLVDPQIISIWRRETIGRASGEMGGAEPWWFYTWNVPMLLLPWTPALLAGLIVAWRGRMHRRPLGSFALCWFGVGFLIVSAFAWKHKHYIMPALPALTLVCAGGLLAFQRDQFKRTSVNYKPILIGFPIGCAVAIVATLIWVKEAPGAIAGLTGVLLVGGTLAILAERARHARLQLIAIFGTAMLVCVGVNRFVLPAHDGYKPSAEFGRTSSAIVPPGQTIWLVGLYENHVAYYLRPPIARVDGLSDSTKLPPTPFYAITSRAKAKQLESIGPVEELDAATGVRRRETDGDRLVLVKVLDR